MMVNTRTAIIVGLLMVLLLLSILWFLRQQRRSNSILRRAFLAFVLSMAATMGVILGDRSNADLALLTSLLTGVACILLVRQRP